MNSGAENYILDRHFPSPVLRSCCHAYADDSLRYDAASVHANRGPGRVSCCHQEENCLSDVVWLTYLAHWQLCGRAFKHFSTFLSRQVVPDRSLDHPRRNSVDADGCQFQSQPTRKSFQRGIDRSLENPSRRWTLTHES